jgi:hypothetical protein
LEEHADRRVAVQAMEAEAGTPESGELERDFLTVGAEKGAGL